MKTKVLLIGFGLLVGCVLGEVGFRFYRYQKLLVIPSGILSTPQTIYRFDEKTGYRYVGPQTARFHWWGEGPALIRSNTVHLNANGHVSSREDSPEKPKNEFRIAVLGDSLSACIHNELPWPDALEDILNREFRPRVNGKKIKVVNFSRDGIGVAQFPKILEEEVRPYHPDMILVNFITADIYRRFFWRMEVPVNAGANAVMSCVSLPATLENPECQFANNLSIREGHDSEERVNAVAREVVRMEANRKPWWTPYPQLLAHLLPEVTATVFGPNPWNPRNATIEDRAEMVETSALAIKEMARKFPDAKFLLLPVYWEIVAGAIPKLAGEVMRASLPVEVTPMVAYMPQNPSRETVDRWTHFPSDMHFSDEGALVYARSVKNYLEELFDRRRRGEGLG